jgi:nucleotide-binding universal stress UspA family protein
MENCKILVPLDFSDAGKYALQAAEKVARLFDGSITPFHAYVPVSDMYGTDIFGFDNLSAPLPDMEEIEGMHYEHLEEFARGAVTDTLLNEPLISVGNPATAIVEAAGDFDLIIMSSHGRSGFSRIFLGSVSDKVLRTAHIPVMIVNEEKQLKSFDRLMLATDFSEHSKEAFPVALEFASKANSRVDLLHIFSFEDHEKDEPDESTISLRKQRLEVLSKEMLSEIDDRLETKVIVSSNTPHEAILNENLNNTHDLIIMSTVGRTGIDYLMMGSTTANVVRHVKSPVLSVNPKNKAASSENEEE